MGKSNSKFTIDDIPDLKGKIAVVTGGNTGIGFAISKALAFKGAHVVISSRNQLKLDKAAEELSNYINKLDQTKSQISTFLVDLSSFTSIKSFANDLTSKFDHIDILINNAGILMNPYSKTEQGFELTLGTNGIVPMIRKSPEEGAISTLFSATSPNAYRYRGKMLDEGPYIKPLDITTSAYTLENANKVFNEINKAIVLAGFEGFKL
eukprot:gene20560-26665_t